jgi:hypothetical protein
MNDNDTNNTNINNTNTEPDDFNWQEWQYQEGLRCGMSITTVDGPEVQGKEASLRIEACLHILQHERVPDDIVAELLRLKAKREKREEEERNRKPKKRRHPRPRQPRRRKGKK